MSETAGSASTLERYGVWPDTIDAGVLGAAQYLARSWLGNGKGGPADDAEFHGYIRDFLVEVAIMNRGVSFGEDPAAVGAEVREAVTSEMVTEMAVRATEIAERMAATNVNWDQWAFGH
jgi:hypothetical protein